jgi:hypothetical protein
VGLPRKTLYQMLGRLLGRLRFPQLFILAALLLVIDLLVPDVIPFADEILLAVVTLALGSLKRPESPPKSPSDEEGPVIDIRPE